MKEKQFVAQSRGETKPERTDKKRQSEVGIQLRKIRKARGRTLRETALAAKITESFLSQIERGITNPSLSTLTRVAEVFGIGVRDLFDDAADSNPRLLRKKDRPVLHFGPHGSKLHLTPSVNRRLDVFTWEFEPGGSTGMEAYTHGDSEEMLLVVAGTVTLWLADCSFEMSAGDSIVYQSSTAHLITESGGTHAEVLWAMTPPSL